MGERIIFHIDVNSAFLSWSAAYRVNVLGEKTDFRQVPAVIAGDKASRHSIILAKSIPAKQFKIQTGEPLFQAMQKCPDLAVLPPDYGLYVESSRKFVALLKQVAPVVEQYSIDEAWADMTGTTRLYGSPLLAAEMLRQEISEKLGFTVNIGISSNKLLAKMASDFQKPDRVHTLFPFEIQEKLWPLPVRELFQVGPATERKLRCLGIYTIGELAKTDLLLLRKKLGKQGEVIWHSANGRNASQVVPVAPDNKGYGNSITIPFDVVDRATAHQVLLSLCETVAMRLRRDHKSGACVTVQMRTNQFSDFSHQQQMETATDVTLELYHTVCSLFDESWDGKTPLRQLGVQVTKLTQQGYRQYDFLSRTSAAHYERNAQLDAVVDTIREKYGEEAIVRARFVGGSLSHMAGGLAKERRTGVTKAV